jgi:hypothetical protein
LASLAVGVGSFSRKAVQASVLPWLSSMPHLFALKVGSKPHSLSYVIRTDVPSSQYPDSSHIPQAGKAFDDGTEALGTKVRTVFREDKARPYLFNNAEHFKPKA